MDKKKTKLKKLDMTSVDLVRRGANQEADIMLYKSADEQPEEDAIPQGLWKAITRWWRENQEVEKMKDFNIAKSSYIDALEYSMESIIKDDTMDAVAKAEMAEESIDQFSEALKSVVMQAIGVYKAENDDVDDEIDPDEETLEEDEEIPSEEETEAQESEETEEGEEEMKIDKSRFTPEELEQYNALIAKGMIEEEGVEKSAEMHPEVKKALEEFEEMKKGMEMKELHNIAKKYAVLGKEEEALVNTLYEMKKSSDSAYNSYIAVLDEQVELVNKSGMFEEIGKSGHGHTVVGGGVVGKIESIASEIQKADPNLARAEAVMKAWDQHPELLAEYEKEYQGGK